jgi:hypothetical protein
MSISAEDKVLYEAVKDCFYMMQTYDYQRIANHKLNEFVGVHGKEKIVALMERAKRKNRV